MYQCSKKCVYYLFKLLIFLTGLRSKNKSPAGLDNNGRKQSIARKIERGGKKGNYVRKNECFSAPAESFLQDFDFQSNLALFDKKAVFQQIENDFPELSLETDVREQKYRHDENVLQPGESTTTKEIVQQIHVPTNSSTKLYYTGKDKECYVFISTPCIFW